MKKWWFKIWRSGVVQSFRLAVVALALVSGCGAMVRDAGLRLLIRDVRSGTPTQPFCFSGLFLLQSKATVVEVAPGSQHFGIRPGDVVKSVDGVPYVPPVVGSLADAWNSWERNRRPGDRVEIGIERDGVDRSVTLVCGDALSLYAKPLLAGAEDLLGKRWDSCLYNAGNVLIAMGPNEYAYILQQQCIVGKFVALGKPQWMVPQLVRADFDFYGTLLRHTRIGGGDIAPHRGMVLQSIDAMRKLGYSAEAAELDFALNHDSPQAEYARRTEQDRRRHETEMAQLQTEKAAAVAVAEAARAEAAKVKLQAEQQRQSQGTTSRPHSSGKPQGESGVTRNDEVELLGTGSCFAVDPSGKVVTSDHVVRDAGAVLVRFPGKKWIAATVARRDAGNDLAVLDVGIPLASVVAFRQGSDPALGEQVFTIGFPVPQILGSSPKYSEGVIASTDGPNSMPSMFQTTIPLQPGNSGGPVLGMDGRVVGVVAASAKADVFIAATGAIPQNINWAVKGSVAASLVPSVPLAHAATVRAEAIKLAEAAACQVATFGWSGGSQHRGTPPRSMEAVVPGVPVKNRL